MATAVGLSFQLTASAVGMTQGVNAAAAELGKLGTAAQKAANDISVLKTLEIGRAFISSVQSIGTTFGSYVSGVTQSVEATGNLSRELGITYSELTAIQLAAQLSGASAESLGKAFTKAQVTITKAAAGGKEAVQALSAIGLSAADFQGLSSSEQFTLIANAISGIADPAQRAAAAVAIFGRSGAELLPVFRELGGNLQQSQELLAKFNGGVSQEQVDRVNSLGDSFDKVAAAIQIKLTQVLSELQPVISATAEQFIDFVSKLDTAKISEFVTGAIQKLADVLFSLGNAALAAGELLGPLVDFLSFVLDNANGAAAGFVAVAGGLKLYANRAAIAAFATTGLSGAIKGLLASTGVGLLVTLVGTLAGAAIEWGFKTEEAGKKSKNAIASTAESANRGAGAVQRFGASVAKSQTDAFNAAEEAAKKAAAEAKRASDSARREADSSIQRLVTEQQFGGDSQRYSAAQAVLAIQADIKRTEEEIAAAREAGDQDALAAGTRRLAQLDQAMAREEEIASGARKAAEQRIKLEADYAKARQAFDERRLAALARPSTELLKLEDTRTVSGYEALQRFSQDQSQDPALEEYRKQLRELQKIRAAIENNTDAVNTVDILGA